MMHIILCFPIARMMVISIRSEKSFDYSERFLPDFLRHRDRLLLVPRSVGMTTPVISMEVRLRNLLFSVIDFSSLLRRSFEMTQHSLCRNDNACHFDGGTTEKSVVFGDRFLLTPASFVRNDTTLPLSK